MDKQILLKESTNILSQISKIRELLEDILNYVDDKSPMGEAIEEIEQSAIKSIYEILEVKKDSEIVKTFPNKEVITSEELLDVLLEKAQRDDLADLLWEVFMNKNYEAWEEIL